jgi:hypothetical protein
VEHIQSTYFDFQEQSGHHQSRTIAVQQDHQNTPKSSWAFRLRVLGEY